MTDKEKQKFASNSDAPGSGSNNPSICPGTNIRPAKGMTLSTRGRDKVKKMSFLNGASLVRSSQDLSSVGKIVTKWHNIGSSNRQSDFSRVSTSAHPYVSKRPGLTLLYGMFGPLSFEISVDRCSSLNPLRSNWPCALDLAASPTSDETFHAIVRSHQPVVMRPLRLALVDVSRFQLILLFHTWAPHNGKTGLPQEEQGACVLSL